jgi:hypothetical protein
LTEAGQTFREMNLNVFAAKPVPHVLFQPRIEPWYDWHKNFGGLPEAYRELSLPGLFDLLKVSMRYVHYYTGMPDPVHRQFDASVQIHEEFAGGVGRRAYETPYGDLVETHKLTVDGTWREVGFPVKAPKDLRKLRWLFGHTTYRFSPDDFSTGSGYVGKRGEPQFWVPKSPYQALAQQWMKLQDLIYALADARAEVEATMQAIDTSYDQLYAEMISSRQVKIVNFGENIHEQLLSPRYFERYLIPFWEKRSGALRGAGTYTHVHIDGYFHNLLPYLRHLPFDGLEALTPLPQGDVPLEQIKEHIGDKVLLDGIPAVLFMTDFSREQLMETVEKVVALFSPRLVLGISDELPEGAGPEALDAVAAVSAWCRNH